MQKGVFSAKKKNGAVYYRASLTYKKKHISLGSFDTEEEAALAYSEACRLLDTPSLSIYSHYGKHALSFEKRVVLLNFRDNGIYIATPIYVYARSRFFYYYLSSSDVLKFDMDDLFFYSSHKIMRRGGHLFVADYGMQINILSRYGIRGFAVAGRDYVFKNGDNTDYRHENLIIINQYHGVEAVTYRGQKKYRARINVPGYFTIGHYSSEIDAAIAYNKAIDILKKNGVEKNYTPNYIDNVPPSVYADIYSRLKISQKIINYNP